MPATCFYKGCGDVQRPLSGVSFFSVPFDQRRPIWRKHSQSEPFTKSAHICEKHFYDSDIKVEGIRKILKKTAVPKSDKTVCNCTEQSYDRDCFMYAMQFTNNMPNILKPKENITKIETLPQKIILKKFHVREPIPKTTTAHETISIPKTQNASELKETGIIRMEVEVEPSKVLTLYQKDSLSTPKSFSSPSLYSNSKPSISLQRGNLTAVSLEKLKDPRFVQKDTNICLEKEKVIGMEVDVGLSEKANIRKAIERLPSHILISSKPTENKCQPVPGTNAEKRIGPEVGGPSQNLVKTCEKVDQRRTIKKPIQVEKICQPQIVTPVNLENDIQTITVEADPFKRSTAGDESYCLPHCIQDDSPGPPEPKRSKEDNALNKSLMTKFEKQQTDYDVFMRLQLSNKPTALWSSHEKNMGLKFFYKSPTFYSYMLSKGFILPPLKILHRWYFSLRLPPGFSNQIMELLSKKLDTMSAKDKMCVILIDEVEIKTELKYNIKDDLICGYSDFGNLGRYSIVASKVKVFSLKGLNKKWEQTIFYDIGCPKSEDIAKIIKNIVSSCMDCGLSVIATVCDKNHDNREAYKLLGANENRAFCQIRDQIVFLLYDYPRLFKSVRNCLLKNPIKIGNDIVSWEMLVRLFNEDSSNNSQLTTSHINPSYWEKNSLKLATQVFSTNVSAGIYNSLKTNCYQDVEEEAFATANFLLKMNALLDNLSSDSVNSYFFDREPISHHSNTLSQIIKARQWISLWESVSENNQPYCFFDLKQTFLGIEQMWEKLKEEHEFLLVPLLNSTFSQPQFNCDSADNLLSATELTHKITKIVFKSCIFSENSPTNDLNNDSDTGLNVDNLDDPDDPDAEDALFKHEDFHIDYPIEDNLFKMDSVNIIEYKNLDDESSNHMVLQPVLSKGCTVKQKHQAALAFLAGFVAYKLRSKINCEECPKYMMASRKNKGREQYVLIQLRLYKQCSKIFNFGNMAVPTLDFEHIVKFILFFFEREFVKRKHVSNIVQTMLDMLLQTGIQNKIQCDNDEHKQLICKFVLMALLKLSLKLYNKDLSATSNDGSLFL